MQSRASPLIGEGRRMLYLSDMDMNEPQVIAWVIERQFNEGTHRECERLGVYTKLHHRGHNAFPEFSQEQQIILMKRLSLVG